MKSTLFFLGLAVLMLGCGQASKRGVFAPEALPTSLYDIRTDADTNLVLDNGIEIFIQKGSISPSDKPVRLKVQTALSVADMLRAGLVTQADGAPLQSGGMIYMDFLDKSAKLLKPIRVKMPTNSFNEEMQLYRGQVDANGNMNWVEPSPLLADFVQAERKKIADAGDLFAKYCGYCHEVADPTKLYTAHPTNSRPMARPQLMQMPDTTAQYLIPLAHLYKYRGPDWLLNLFASGDLHADSLLRPCFYGSKPMALPNADPKQLSREELIRIFDYIEALSEQKNIPIPPYNAERCKEECAQQLAEVEKLRASMDTLRQIQTELAKKSDEKRAELEKKKEAVKEYMVTVVNGSTRLKTRADGDPMAVDSVLRVVAPTHRKSSYYVFEVQALGYWLNVDCDMRKMYKNLNLVVNTEGVGLDRVEVFIVIPSHKIFLRAGLRNNSRTEYVFYETNGNAPLPLGASAWLYSIGEEEGRFFLGQKAIALAVENKHTLTIKDSSKEKIEAALKLMSQEFTLKIEDSGRREVASLQAAVEELDTKVDSISTDIFELSQLVNAAYATPPKSCICACQKNAK